MTFGRLSTRDLERTAWPASHSSTSTFPSWPFSPCHPGFFLFIKKLSCFLLCSLSISLKDFLFSLCRSLSSSERGLLAAAAQLLSIVRPLILWILYLSSVLYWNKNSLIVSVLATIFQSNTRQMLNLEMNICRMNKNSHFIKKWRDID